MPDAGVAAHLPGSVARERLHAPCDPGSLGFETTDDVEPLDGTLGQDQALKALDFGLSVGAEGFNIFVLGPDGSGRMTAVRRLVRERARGQPTPGDWCHVFDFDDPRRPGAVELPPGRGPVWREEMDRLVSELRRVLPEALDSDEVSSRRMELVRGRARKAEEAVEACRDELRDDPHVAVIAGGEGFTVVPARGGEPIQEDAFRALPQEQQDEIQQHLTEARDRLASLQRQIHQLRRETGTEVERFNQEVASSVVRPRMAALKESYRDVPAVVRHLDRVEEDIQTNALRLAQGRDDEEIPILQGLAEGDFARRYRVNVLVTHRPGSGAPFVEEANPTLKNVFGQVEGRVRFGVMVTDFTRIVAGAAQRANGGYLVLEAREVLTHPFVWNALKRALRTGELRPGDAGSEMGLAVAESLEPRPIPARLRVVLVGEPEIFYLLQALDPHFDELFKIKVDFGPDMDRNPASERGLAAWVARECRERGLLPLTAQGVALLVEEASREAEDQRKLTARLRPLGDRMVEADRLAREAGADRVDEGHLADALAAREARESRPRERLLELVERGVLAFDPEGAEVGQLHGIALLFGGGLPFGRPIRVLASAYAGKEGVINIERETQLSGPIHNKGFLVLSGYLGRNFARSRPLLLSATLSFDQLYEEVEGDSAAAAELYALLSAVGDIPVRQGIAVTGAINQEGVLLPVGGVTHKVEGFFAACERRGLTGEQGVLLPARNVENLVLRRNVRDAVERGDFHLWAVDRVEDGWPILAGMPAGEMDQEGLYPEGSVHAAVQARLDAWAEGAALFGDGPGVVLALPEGTTPTTESPPPL